MNRRSGSNARWWGEAIVGYMYVLADGTLPSPWALVTTWNGRYLRCGSSVGQHGSVGGVIQHRHLTKATTSGSCSGLIPHWGYGATFVHSHSIPAVYTGYSNNDPLYRTLSLWRIDYSVWESTWRSFPKNAIVLSYSSISAAGLGRWSAGDGRLVLLGTPGSNGGRSTHTDHTLTATLSPGGAGGQGGDPAGGGASDETHSHTFSATEVPSNTLMPARVMTRFYVATDTTDRAPAGVVCFFDSAPSANWALVSEWAGRFPMSFDSDPVTEGLDSHGHSAVSGSSSNHSTNDGAQTYFAGSATMANRTHNHTVSIEADQADHLPEYVHLCPYRLTVTLYKQSTVPKTWSASSILKLARPNPVQVAARFQTSGSQFIEATSQMQISSTEDIGVDSELMGEAEEDVEVGAIALARRLLTAVSSAMFVLEGASVGISAHFAKRAQGTPLVLDSMLKSYVDQFDKVQMLVQGMEWANRLDTSTGTELDLKWGHVFNLPRLTGETDDTYRMRIMIFTLAAMGCGTAPAVGQILSAVAGIPGSVEIETLWPGEAHIRFRNPDAARTFRDSEELVTQVLGMSMPAGIDYSLYYPLRDLAASALFRGASVSSAEVDLVLVRTDRTAAFGMSSMMASSSSEPVDLSALLIRMRAFAFRVGPLLMRRGQVPVGATARLKRIRVVAAGGSAALMTPAQKQAHVAAYAQKQGLARTGPVTARALIRSKRPMLVRTRMVGAASASVSMSVRVVAAS